MAAYNLHNGISESAIANSKSYHNDDFDLHGSAASDRE